MQKIAMFGGTFNPIHNGHIHMALEFAHKLELDKVIIIPANIPPHKSFTNAASARDRLAMCEIAVSGHPLLQVSDIEIKREGPSYTVDTLRILAVLYPDALLHLITGADMFLTIQNWRRAEEIFRLAVICAAPREKNDISVLQKHANGLKLRHVRCEVVNMPLVPVSSTQIRNHVKAGMCVQNLVPDGVAQYIVQHNLYRE